MKRILLWALLIFAALSLSGSFISVYTQTNIVSIFVFVFWVLISYVTIKKINEGK